MGAGEWLDELWGQRVVGWIVGARERLDELLGPESGWMDCGGWRVVGWIMGAGEWLDELWGQRVVGWIVGARERLDELLGPESGWMDCGGQREVG